MIASFDLGGHPNVDAVSVSWLSAAGRRCVRSSSCRVAADYSACCDDSAMHEGAYWHTIEGPIPVAEGLPNDRAHDVPSRKEQDIVLVPLGHAEIVDGHHAAD